MKAKQKWLFRSGIASVNRQVWSWANDLLLFSVSVLVFLVIILMLHLTLKTDSILSECSEYRTKCDNLYHLCQMQEKELEHLRALIDAHNIDY